MLDRIFLLILCVFLLIYFAVRADVVDVLVQIHRILGDHLDKAAANVRAVVGYTLKVVEHICKDKAVLDGALAFLQTNDMIKLDLVAKVIYNLLERLDVNSKLNIVVLE